MIQQTKIGYASESSNKRPTFSWRLVIKDCLYFVAIAILLVDYELFTTA